MDGLTAADFQLEDDEVVELLEQVKATIKKHFKIVDWLGIVIILAVAAAHYAAGEMLWFRIIGPSRSGKTEILRAIAQHPDCVKLEVLTPASLRGGLKKGFKVLSRLDGKLVITKDLASLLTTSREARTEIFGLLRPIKDGELISDFGNEEGHVEQKVYFDWIAATTPMIEQQRQLESLLGERFIDIRWRPGNSEEMAYQAALNNPCLESEIRPQVAVDVCILLGEASKIVPNMEITPDELKVISQYADRTARLRTPIQRDRFRNVISSPAPEIGTDLAQGFSRIVKGLKALSIEWEPCLNRLMWDCMPEMRARVLECILKGITDEKVIASTLGPALRTVEYIIEDLRLLKVIDKHNHPCIQLNLSK